jgi:hypothetical protein
MRDPWIGALSFVNEYRVAVMFAAGENASSGPDVHGEGPDDDRAPPRHEDKRDRRRRSWSP